MPPTTLNNDLRRPLYATVGMTDRAVELLRESLGDLRARVVELQRSIENLDRQPAKLRLAALEVLSEQADAVDARVAELQTRARQLPERVHGYLEKHEVAYDQLVARGDALIRRVRRQKSTRDAVNAGSTTSSKAKTTGTQAANAARGTARSAQRAARNTTATARRQSKTPQSSAKATATSARRTAKSAARATADAAGKVGD